MLSIAWVKAIADRLVGVERTYAIEPLSTCSDTSEFAVIFRSKNNTIYNQYSYYCKHNCQYFLLLHCISPSFKRTKKSILLLNKSDLERKVTKEEIKKICKEYNIENIPVIEISAKEEKGIDRLEEIVKEMFYHGEISFNNEIYITNIRHKTALERAKDSLMKVIESIENDMPEDFYSIDLMDAYETLGSITGEMVGEDLVNEIFSKFCMGK